MITRAHRFHGYNSLRHVYGRGQIVRGPFMAIKYLRNPRRSSYRAAVVVSRKVHKSAVVRGRIRRRIYEVIRGYETEINQPYDIVVTVFSEALATMPAAELKERMSEHLVRAKIITAPGTVRVVRPSPSPSAAAPGNQPHSRTHGRPHSEPRDIVDGKERTA